MEWCDILVGVLSGLAVTIPLVIKLIEYVEKSVKEKNWNKLFQLVINLIEEAEGKFDNGVDRRKWVLTCVKASADTINYDINLDVVGELIDSLCAMAKMVNAPNEDAEIKNIEG